MKSPSAERLPPLPDSSGQKRRWRISLVTLGLVIIAFVLTIPFRDKHPPAKSVPKVSPPILVEPLPDPTNTPCPVPTPRPPPDPATAAAAHGTSNPLSISKLFFTCVWTDADSKELSRRSWMFEPSPRLITSLDQEIAYQAENVTDQLADLDAEWQKDSFWFLLPFRMQETKPDLVSERLLLINGGPSRETLTLALDEAGLLETAETELDSSDTLAKVRIESWCVFENVPELKLPSSIIFSDGTRVKYEKTSVEPADGDSLPVADPEAWPSVKEERSTTTPENEGG